MSRAICRTLTLVCLAPLGLTATGCVTTQDIQGLGAQISDVQRQVLQMQKQAPSKQEVASIETSVGRQMEILLKTEADMLVKLQELSAQIDELQAKLEDSNYRLGQLSQQIASANQEIRSMRPVAPPPAPALDPSDAPPGSNPPPASSPSSGTVTSDPQTLYNAAYNDYLKGNYDLAVRGFQEYLSTFPATDLADNATYWIGECYYRQKRYRPAIERYDAVLNRYPRSDKIASALLKKGYAHLELGERSQGVLQLQSVIRQYSTSDEANLARQRMKDLGGN